MKRKVIAQLILFLLLTINLVAFARNDVAPVQTSLPLKFNTGNPAPYGLPSTTISIQGKVIPILFDTGAEATQVTLSRYALKDLHVKFTGAQVCYKAFDGKHCEKKFIIPELKLGTFILKNVEGTEMLKLWGGQDKGFTETEASKDGAIGYNLLSQFNILLDYPHHKAILFRRGVVSKQYDFSKWTAISFKGQLHTNMIINGKLFSFSWDTGAVPSIIKSNMLKNMQLFSCPKNTPFEKINGCKRIITKNFTTIQGVQLPATWFVLEDIPSYAPFDGLVGSNFYMQNLVYFDFDNQKIYLKRADS